MIRLKPTDIQIKQTKVNITNPIEANQRIPQRKNPCKKAKRKLKEKRNKLRVAVVVGEVHNVWMPDSQLPIDPYFPL